MYPVMRNRLHAVLMASTVIATSLSFTSPYVHAQARPGSIVTSTDDDGRKVFTNDSPSASTAPAARKQAAPASSSNGLVYWSPKDKKWKSVPNANVRAARTAAAEVNDYLGNDAVPHPEHRIRQQRRLRTRRSTPPSSRQRQGITWTPIWSVRSSRWSPISTPTPCPTRERWG